MPSTKISPQTQTSLLVPEISWHLQVICLRNAKAQYLSISLVNFVKDPGLLDYHLASLLISTFEIILVWWSRLEFTRFARSLVWKFRLGWTRSMGPVYREVGQIASLSRACLYTPGYTSTLVIPSMQLNARKYGS